MYHKNIRGFTEWRFLANTTHMWGTKNQSLPPFQFPETFSLGVDSKHFSNTFELTKIIDKAIIRNVLSLMCFVDKLQMKLLCIWHEITYFVKVPNNMTHLSQQLDLTVNGNCKMFIKNKFSEWYTQVDNALQTEVEFKNINIESKLTTVKPIHTKWIVDYYKNELLPRTR